MPQVRVGISGWTYPPWRGNFYPDGLPQRLELAYASRRFNALEINGTFYSLQRASSFRAWYDQTPPGFVFSMKGGKYITHQRKLREIDVPLANYFASGPLALREKLGPILWQFPPFLRFDPDRFRAFFDLLPRDTVEMARLAQKHDPWLADRAAVEADAKRPVRHAVEFRHESFMTEAFISLLREYNIALVVADVASKFPTTEDVTADWVYVRLHGSRQLYISGYTPEEIETWARKIDAWRTGREPADARRVAPPMKTPANVAKAGGRDVFIFFDNTDIKQRAPVDARAMAERLGVGPTASPQDIFEELGVSPQGPTRERLPKSRAAPTTGLAPRRWGRSQTRTTSADAAAGRAASKPGARARKTSKNAAEQRPSKPDRRSSARAPRAAVKPAKARRQK